MPRWTGIALALRRPDDDALKSRLSTYLHPLAGRSLVWHVLHSLGAPGRRPRQLLLVTGDASLAGGLDDLRADMIVPARGVPWGNRVVERLHPSTEAVLVVDAAAAALDGSLNRLLEDPVGRALRAPDGSPVAAWLGRDAFLEIAGRAPDLESLVATAERDGGEGFAAAGDDVFLVRNRAGLARAAGMIQRRLTAALMRGGATFLDPDSVVVDVDVRVGPDSVIYPGCILEGGTTIGSETVIGPACRIVDSQIGSGVELKGWNYLVNTTIRNHAVLEPYVRRGYD